MNPTQNLTFPTSGQLPPNPSETVPAGIRANTVQPTMEPMDQTPYDSQPLSEQPISTRNVSVPVDKSAKFKMCLKLVLLALKQQLPASIAEKELTHYQGTSWARDNSMMAVEALLEQDLGLKALGDILRVFMNYQVVDLTPGSNKSFPGDQHNNLGALPIVVVNNPSDFVRARVIERKYLAKVQEFFHQHPQLLAGKQLPELFTLDKESAHAYVMTTPPENLKAQITAVYQFIESLKTTIPHAQSIQFPKANFSLQNWITDNLARLTPGTTDPEINVLRLSGKYLTALSATNPSKAQAEGHQLTPMLARALIYIYTNVMGKEGLPVGADYLDIFNDILANSCLLTNASILLDGLKSLQNLSGYLDDTAFKQELNKAGPHLPLSLKSLPDEASVETMLASLSQQLQDSLRTHLLFDADQQFKPRWFVRSEHQVANPTQPPKIITDMLALREAKVDAPKFKDGSITDPFGLAWAVIADAVPHENYQDVCKLFEQFFEEEGRLFIPMANSGPNEKLMVANEGYTFWPDKILRCGIALMCMYNTTGDVKYLELAKEIHDKVSTLDNFNEYYLKDSKTPKFVPSGSENQGWHVFTYYQLSEMLKNSSMGK